MKIVRMLASFFYVGYLPMAPGTWGSLAGLGIACFFYDSLPYIFLGLTFLGQALSRPARHAFGSEDPKAFVLDEVCGMMLTLLWIPKTIPYFLVGFGLFRALDVLKPWPIDWLERRKSPLSIMWDDLAAGFIGNLMLQAASRILSVF